MLLIWCLLSFAGIVVALFAFRREIYIVAWSGVMGFIVFMALAALSLGNL